MEQQTQHQAAASDDEKASLAYLQAGALDDQDPAAQIEQQENASNQARIKGELSGLINTFVGLAGPMLPSLKVIYTPTATDQAADAVAAVCVKHGWLEDGIMQGYQEEITAAFILAPLGIATYHGVKGDIAAIKRLENKTQDTPASQAAPVPGSYQEPGSRTVTFGTVQPVEEGAAVAN